MLDFEADLREIFAGDFSEPIEIFFNGLPSGDQVRITGLFDRTFQQVDMDTGALIASRNAMASVQESEVREALQASGYFDDPFIDGDQVWMVKVAGMFFRVVRPEYDGKGIIMLVLKKADMQPPPPPSAASLLEASLEAPISG
jgi:hypothetical protein